MPVTDATLRQIEDIESGGDPNAKNPRSSASGLYQFIASTWMETVKRYEPVLMQGRTEQEVLDLRFDTDISRRMGRAFTEANVEMLESAGIEVTPGRVYLAHFLGASGARAALSADADAGIADVLGERVVRANPFLKGKAIKDLDAWADSKMGAVAEARTPPSPRSSAPCPHCGRGIKYSVDSRLSIEAVPFS
jgi:hypothetical protein